MLLFFIPVAIAVVDGGVGQRHADADDDRTGNDRREEAHDLLGAKALNQRSQHQIQERGAGDAHAGVGQKLGFAVGRDGGIAREERERAAQKYRALTLSKQLIDQRAYTCAEKSGGDYKTHYCKL